MTTTATPDRPPNNGLYTGTGKSALSFHIELTLTQLARESAARMSRRPYRRADDGAWCEPTVPHVPGCTCPPGQVGCKRCWDAYLRHVAVSTAT